MVAAAFEWGLQRTEIYRLIAQDYSRAYPEFLQQCGYRLSDIEHLMAGHGEKAEPLSPHQSRVLELRNAEYNLTRNHGLGLMNHEMYEQLLEPVVAELIQLGETPEPRPNCCK